MKVDSIKKLDTANKLEWVKAFGKAKKKGLDDESSVKVASKYVIHQFEKSTNPTMDTLRMNFVESKGEFLQNDANGEIYFEAILGGEQDARGYTYSPEVLQKWADQINSNDYSADINHEYMNKALNIVGSEDEIKNIVKAKPGITKRVRAFVEGGLMKIRAWIDKRYKRLIEKAQGLSLEAHVQRYGNNITDGEFLGWTIVDEKAKNPPAIDQARITKIEE